MRYVAYTPNATLGIPQQSNIDFATTANIAPSYHVGVRTYNENGIVPHPLGYTGQPGSPVRRDTAPRAGQTSTGAGQQSATIAYPHAYTIGGKRPGL